ncbi:MAG: ABC transporter permease [Candidatus Thermoplasmatota archaeon]|nr:ABC transporter permease [Candidatus Thermoplasmatota archaeon]
MKPFFYEFLQRIRAKSAVVFTILLTVLLIALVYTSYSSISSSVINQPSNIMTGALFNHNGTYYFDTYVFNSSTGKPVTNIPINFTLYNSDTGGLSNYQYETNSLGYSNFTSSNISNPTYCTFEANFAQNNRNSEFSEKPGGLIRRAISATPYGQSCVMVWNICKPSPIAPPSILIVSLNATGSPGGNLMIYYNYSCNTTGYKPINKSDILGAVYKNFSVVTFSPKISDQYDYTDVLFEENGKQISEFATFSAISSPPGNLESAFNFEYPIVAFIMGILGISLAYFSYNKDRISGAYQELIVRPNTRVGLMTSRFLSVSFLLLVSSSLIGLSTYIIPILLFSFYMPFSFIMYIIFSSFVLSESMAAISFIIGSKEKSAAAVIAIPLVIFILIVLFVPAILPDILSKLGIFPGTENYNLITLIVSLFDPASSFSVIGSPLFRPIMSFTSLYLVGSALWMAVVYSISWVTIPYIGNYFLSKTTD